MTDAAFDPDAELQAAMAAHNAGRAEDAARGYERLLAADPGHVDALNLLAIIEMEAGRLDRALNLAGAAAARLEHPYVLGNLGEILLAAGDAPGAEASLGRALELAPDDDRLWGLMTSALARQDRLEEAEEANARVLARRPDDAQALANLGAFAIVRDDLAVAQQVLERAAALQPDGLDALLNLGKAHLEQDRPDLAEAVCRRALAAHPGEVRALRDLGDALLHAGKWAEAWPFYSHRVSAIRLSGNMHAPIWDGGPLNGGTFLLVGEQGLGDVIQFVRYAPWLKGRGAGRIVLGAAEPLRRLLSLADGVDEVVALDALPQDIEAWASVMSLPGLHGLTPDRRSELLPHGLPYIRLPQPSEVETSDSPGPGAPLRVGLFWAGELKTLPRLVSRMDAARSLELDQVLPLLEAPELEGRVAWTILQRDRRPAGLDERARVRNWADPFAAGAASPPADLLDTARIIAGLDLVIGVDSALIHLAGALGRPAWMLDRRAHCWRWAGDEAHSDWYPNTLRIFRQSTRGDWEGPLTGVRQALARMAALAPLAESQPPLTP